MKDPREKPRDLSKKLVLGAIYYAGSWYASNTRVTNLNIYSSPLSIERMKRMTRSGSYVEEGDYLA